MAIVPETAALSPCELIMNPTDPKYTDVTVRQFQGCPTIAATRGGRLYVDVDPRADRHPAICTKQDNDFDGEPCDPVPAGAEVEFIPHRDTW